MLEHQGENADRSEDDPFVHISTDEYLVKKKTFPRLSSPHNEIKSTYDVVVVGSGYGASIAASRCARAGQRVCVLEKGKEWLPGDFPETFGEASSTLHINDYNCNDIEG